MPVFKRDMEGLTQYYEHTLPQMGIRIKYLKEATVEAARECAPDIIIWAAGGRPIRPASIPGIFNDNVVLTADALRNLDIIGDKIAVIGGGLVGCEAAAHFALIGKQVSVVEMAPAILPEELFPQNRAAVMHWIDKSGLTKYEGSKLVSIGSGKITIEGPAGSIEIAEGVIAAKRHIHLTPADAAELEVKDKDVVWVRVNTEDRSLIFGDVVCRVSDKFARAMHIDTDESNAAGCKGTVMGEIVRF